MMHRLTEILDNLLVAVAGLAIAAAFVMICWMLGALIAMLFL